LNADGSVDVTKNNGNIAKHTISFQGLSNPFVQAFKYDSLERLIEAKETTNGSQNWIQTFDYDRYGNRTSFSQTIGTTQLAINNLTHPTIDPNTNRFTTGQGYTYDFNGNLITDAQGRKFSFNGDNKQVEVRDSNNNVVGQYFYDADGNRVKKVVPSTNETTVFVYDGSGKLVAEYSTQQSQTPTTSYVATDTLQSVRAITNQNGEVISRRDFMPFGEELYAGTPNRTESNKYSTSGSDNVRKRFTGYEKDQETGLDFAEARYYNNQHGRFTAVDPLLASGKSANPQTFNRYVYVMNSPLRLTDPTGMQTGTPTGRWYAPKEGDGVPVYIKFGKPVPHNLEPITKTNRWSGENPIYEAVGLDEFHVVMLNPNGPRTPRRMIDVRTGKVTYEKLTDWERDGFAIIYSDKMIEPNPGVQDVSLETVFAVQGVGSLARFGASRTLSGAFSTSESGAVFYSGVGARNYAMEYATLTGRKTIDQTIGGRVLSSITDFKIGGRTLYNRFPGASDALWRRASRQFASGASGDITFFRGRNFSSSRVWGTVERPILQQNPNVFRINEFKVPGFVFRPQ
jgi:RHS repeat-associated protein